jgi:four helix bundle protein
MVPGRQDGGKAMPTFTQFEDMEAWRQARVLCLEIYRVSGKGSFAKDFGLRDQIRRASISIMSNMAEGFERSGTGEFIQFLAIAKGSAGEIKSQLYIALDQGYITREDFGRLSGLASDTARMIAGLMSYLRKAGVKGTKYKTQQT